jgi:type IV secretory pathway TraG/TraD family ATPase VirD4
MFKAMQRNTAYGGVITNAGAMYEELLETSPRTLMSVLQVARTNTEFLDSPLLRGSLTKSSFKLADLKRKKTTLYLCLPQRYMESHYRWLRMMTTLILGEMERERPEPAPEHPVLMVLDEFPALRRMKVIENAAAQIAGYGVKLMFVAQTLAQLKDTYKDNWETLVANAGLKLFFGNDDHFTREYVSKLMGELEIRRWAKSQSETQGTSKSEGYGSHAGRSSGTSHGTSSSIGMNGEHMSASFGTSYSTTRGWSEGTSQNVSHGTSQRTTEGGSETFHKRYLLNPDEVGRLFGNRENPAMLALASGTQPLALNRTMYFADQKFEGLFDPHRDHKPPQTLNDRRLTALRLAEYTRLRAEEEKRKAKERETLEAMRKAEAKTVNARPNRNSPSRLKALARGTIQMGFVAALAWGAMSYPPIGKNAHQIASAAIIQWEILSARLF